MDTLSASLSDAGAEVRDSLRVVGRFQRREGGRGEDFRPAQTGTPSPPPFRPGRPGVGGESSGMAPLFP